MTEIVVPEDEGQYSLFETALHRREGADFVFTQSTVLKRDNKYALIGVPFVVTEVTFQRVPEVVEDNGPGYVTLTATIAPSKYVQHNATKGFIPNCKTVEAWNECYQLSPGERLIINDGSKGIRRQIVEQFHVAGLITVPDLNTEYLRKHFHNRYDMPWTEWEESTQTEVHNVDGEEVLFPKFTKGPSGNDLLILVERGLRASKDPQAPAGHSDTFYLS